MRWDGGELTYAGLSELADRLAQLQRRGVGPESVVATCLPRGADLVAAVLAILRAGAAYLPLDPENPADRLAYMCADAGVRLVVTSATWADRVPPGLPILELEALDEGLGARLPWRWIPGTWPTSSTRRVRPAAPRGDGRAQLAGQRCRLAAR